MAKKKKRRQTKEQTNPKEEKTPFHSPFEQMKALKEQLPKSAEEKRPAEKPKARKPEKSEALSDDELFRQSVRDAEPLEFNVAKQTKKPPMATKRNEELEEALEFMRMASGETPFDITATDEYIEGNVRGLHRNILKRLRKGEYAIQAHIDLHGLTRQEAKEALAPFLHQSQLKGHRCVLVVHGRGMHSKDRIPILKEAVRAWFERGKGAIGKRVLAFTSARPVDGGLGAMYVLLRKPKGKTT